PVARRAMDRPQTARAGAGARFARDAPRAPATEGARSETAVPEKANCACPPAFHPRPVALAGMGERVALVRDARHQLLPRLHERLRAVTLQLDAERVDIDAGPCEARQHRFGISSVLGHHAL